MLKEKPAKCVSDVIYPSGFSDTTAIINLTKEKRMDEFLKILLEN